MATNEEVLQILQQHDDQTGILLKDEGEGFAMNREVLEGERWAWEDERRAWEDERRAWEDERRAWEENRRALDEEMWKLEEDKRRREADSKRWREMKQIILVLFIIY